MKKGTNGLVIHPDGSITLTCDHDPPPPLPRGRKQKPVEENHPRDTTPPRNGPQTRKA
jgi:hypothetical protein